MRTERIRNAALFLWDYLVTLDMEVNYVWGQKLSAASGLFILNRYTNLLITILELIEQAPFETPQVESYILTLWSLRRLTLHSRGMPRAILLSIRTSSNRSIQLYSGHTRTAVNASLCLAHCGQQVSSAPPFASHFANP